MTSIARPFHLIGPLVLGACWIAAVRAQPVLAAGAAPQLTPTNPDLERRDRPATEEDILGEADDLLRDESVWNRQDDRDCEDDESTGKRSLFCALQKGCIAVLGNYDHRRVALQEVRFAIQDVAGGRKFQHRLRDFNNLPDTRFYDVKKVLQTPRARVAARLPKE